MLTKTVVKTIHDFVLVRFRSAHFLTFWSRFRRFRHYLRLLLLWRHILFISYPMITWCPWVKSTVHYFTIGQLIYLGDSKWHPISTTIANTAVNLEPHNCNFNSARTFTHLFSFRTCWKTNKSHLTGCSDTHLCKTLCG